MSRHRFIVLTALLLASCMSAGCWPFADDGQRSRNVNSSDAVPYSVLEDGMGAMIRIGVDSAITEKQLRATLSKAADDHQDDAARDYLTLNFLRVDAYLVKDGRRSTTAAGTLQRYVPPGNPAERKKITTDRTKRDTFTISIDEAARTLN